MANAVFFDFDGVIVDSANIKTAAFYELFLKFGEEKAKRVKEYHIKNQGVSRFEKFRSIFKNILRLQYSDLVEKKYSQAFSEIVLKKIVNADFIPGVLFFLEELKKKNIKIFLLSATPEDELKKICWEKDIDSYFYKIAGSPKSKVEHGKEIISDFNLAPKEIVFFGDSASDLQASRELGTQFIGVTHQSKNVFLQDKIPIIVNFKGYDVEQFAK